MNNIQQNLTSPPFVALSYGFRTSKRHAQSASRSEESNATHASLSCQARSFRTKIATHPCWQKLLVKYTIKPSFINRQPKGFSRTPEQGSTNRFHYSASAYRSAQHTEDRRGREKKTANERPAGATKNGEPPNPRRRI